MKRPGLALLCVIGDDLEAAMTCAFVLGPIGITVASAAGVVPGGRNGT